MQQLGNARAPLFLIQSVYFLSQWNINLAAGDTVRLTTAISTACDLSNFKNSSVKTKQIKSQNETFIWVATMRPIRACSEGVGH